MLKRDVRMGRYVLLGLLMGGRGGLAEETAEKFVDLQYRPFPETVSPDKKFNEFFSALVVHPNGKVYFGTCNYHGYPKGPFPLPRSGAHLCSYDPTTDTMEDLADMQAVTGEEQSKAYPQSKIHTQLVVDTDGKIYFGTHSAELYTGLTNNPEPEIYPGGHWIVHDPVTKKTKDLGLPLPHEAIMSVAIDRQRHVVYGITHPSPHFLAYDITTKETANYGLFSMYPTRALIALADGRAYTADDQGRFVRFDPVTRRLEKLPVQIPTHATTRKNNLPFRFCLGPDGRKIYGSGWSSGLLFEYDPGNGPNGSVRELGPTYGPDGKADLLMSPALAPNGKIYYLGYERASEMWSYNLNTGAITFEGWARFNGQALRAGGIASDTAPDGTLYFGVLSSELGGGIAFFKPEK